MQPLRRKLPHLFQRGVGPVEMQRIDQNASIGRAGRLHDRPSGTSAFHRCPGHELQIHRRPFRRQRTETGKRVCQARDVGISPAVSTWRAPSRRRPVEQRDKTVQIHMSAQPRDLHIRHGNSTVGQRKTSDRQPES
jgi:hypothetical protein